MAKTTAFDMVPLAHQKLIEENPRHVLLLGFLRTHLGIVPPPEATKTSAALKKFLKSTAAEVKQATRKVSVSITQDISGTERYFNTRSLSGTVDVPLNIIQQGWEVVDDWLRLNAPISLPWEYGDSETGDTIGQEEIRESSFDSDSEEVVDAEEGET